MDFWARLIGGGSPRKQAASNNPQQRLARFRKVYNHVLQTWHKTSSIASDPAASESLRTAFHRLTSILHEESRSPAPHLCLSFASSSKIYIAVSRIASTAHHEGITREAVAVFAALVDSEEEDFLENGNFAQSLMTFISKVTGRSAIMVIGEDTESEVVELLFGIAAKIRLQPEILPVWFTTRTKEVDERASIKADFAGITQKEDFPLCYQLIDHVHHDGRIGDFARTGLLYIFESASKSQELEQWIVESDLATLMASSLGALYSQLSRKLNLLRTRADIPIVLSLSDYIEWKPSLDAESLYSPEFRLHMDTFLSFLTFWQDVLEHCRSIDVRQTLIDHFQVLFLQQLLYPSLLESSDIDGGSAVAVLTYLRRILDSLDHPELIHMILHYLLALPDPTASDQKSPLALIRRRSLMLLAQASEDDDRLNPSLFNLVDLIMASAESVNPQTVLAALRLMAIILHKNHDYAAGTLLRVVNVHHREPQRTIGALNAEMERYLGLAADIGGQTGMDDAYALHLSDMRTLLEIHPCSYQKLTSELKQSGNGNDYFSLVSRRSVQLHQLAPEDPLLDRLLKLLQRFFTNDVETNMALTEAFIMLGSCAQLRLEGWLAVEPLRYEFGAENPYDPIASIEDESIRKIYKARREPNWPKQYTPAILSRLLGLQEQLNKLRAHIPDLTDHIANRKQAFRVHDEISEAMASNRAQSSPYPAADMPAGSWTPQIPKHLMEDPVTPSRSSTPRGRKEALGARQSSTHSSPSRSGRLSTQNTMGSPGSASRRMSPAVKKQMPQTAILKDVANAIDQVAKDEALKRKVRFITRGNSTVVEVFSEMWDADEEQEGNARADARSDDDDEIIAEATLNHVLTNAVILQEFILQIVAIMQIRASLFDEVRFG